MKKKIVIMVLSLSIVPVVKGQRVKGAEGKKLEGQVFPAFQAGDIAKLDNIARQVGNTPMGRLAQVYSAYLKQDRTALANLLAQGVQQAQKYLDQLQQQAQAAAARPAVVPPPLPPRRVGPPPVPPGAFEEHPPIQGPTVPPAVPPVEIPMAPPPAKTSVKPRITIPKAPGSTGVKPAGFPVSHPRTVSSERKALLEDIRKGAKLKKAPPAIKQEAVSPLEQRLRERRRSIAPVEDEDDNDDSGDVEDVW